MPVLLLALIVFLSDQISKLLVRQWLQPNQSVPVLNNIFHLTYINNPGAAFGIFAYQTPLFIILTLAVIGIIIIAYKQFPIHNRLNLKLALALQLGGALGNLLDRIRFGYVVDFLDFRVWPVFNLADVAIVLGVGLIIWELWRKEEKGEAQ
ncbi:signal peptidase II Aspartic peptidase. MEROPS family A08 [Thermanaeromonas toyohensis ToBE]|uniref:Lipoprotein signal peptidase n=1 Tax=Thermanaeromonas toyohensis ToBE TaxID=698762 RepID=A0A1W1VMB1_9FIRM|nr:signal peptidase II [Thermanaeromonas toyohensis]SMB94458.1 signal peptidase II Aspartic peptidase. MEROPS family A08 [Thermanaeromonas toyohensis ToBE]